MTSRHRHRRNPSGGSNTTTHTTASTASTTVQAPNPTRMGSSQPPSAPSVRRTLFNPRTNPIRRPASATPADNGLPTDITTGMSGNSNLFGGSKITKSIPKIGPDLLSPLDNGDIVDRDKNGCYKVDIPILPPGLFGEEVDGGELMEGIEHSGGAEMVVEEGGELGGRDKESTLHPYLHITLDLKCIKFECEGTYS